MAHHISGRPRRDPPPRGRRSKPRPPKRPGSPTDAQRFALRLEHLMQSCGDSQTAFAKRCGLTPTNIGAYLRAETQPSFDVVHRIVAATDVSLDWLLLGDGGDGPILRGQSRATATLEDDLAAHVARALRGETGRAAKAEVDGAALLAHAVTAAADYLSRVTEMARAGSAALAVRGLALTLAEDATPEGRRIAKTILRQVPLDTAPWRALAAEPRIVRTPTSDFVFVHVERYAEDGSLRAR